MRYLALLRGINVGGRHKVSKEQLKDGFESLGFEGVKTYIQSGNILFRSDPAPEEKLEQRIESHFRQTFPFEIPTLVLSYQQYDQAVASAPPEWGEDSDWKHNAVFPLGQLDSEELLQSIPEPHHGLESAWTGPGVLFWSASKKALGRTSYSKLAKSPLYRRVTIRNRNTTLKLRELLDEI